MGKEEPWVKIYAITEDKEVFLCEVWGLDDAGSMLKEYYPNLANDVKKANLKWSQIKGFRLELPDGYLVDD